MPYAEITPEEYIASQSLSPEDRVSKVLVTGTAPQIANTRHLPFLREALNRLGLADATTARRPSSQYYNNGLNFEIDTGGKEPERILWMTEMGTAHLSGHLAHARYLGMSAAVLVGIVGGLSPELPTGTLFVPSRVWGNDSAMVNRPLDSTDRIFRPDEALQTLLTRKLGMLYGQPIFALPTTTCEVMAEQSGPMAERWATEGYVGVEMEAAYLFGNGERHGYPTAATLSVCDELFEGGRTIHHRDFAETKALRDEARLTQYMAALGALLEFQPQQNS